MGLDTMPSSHHLSGLCPELEQTRKRYIYVIFKIFKIFILLSNWGYWRESRQSCSVSFRRGLNAFTSNLVGLRGHNQSHGGRVVSVAALDDMYCQGVCCYLWESNINGLIIDVADDWYCCPM